MVRTFLVLIMLAAACLSVAEPRRQPYLMPMPASVQQGSGQLALDTSFTVAGSADNPALQRALGLFLEDLRRKTGMTALSMKVTDSRSAIFVVKTDRPSRDVPELGEDESYRLEVSSSGAILTAATTLGAMRGLETFLQLAEATPRGFAVPAMTIQDKPRFPWRGLMIDVSRHFIPIAVLKRNLDGMAAVKLNVFHWHLSDDQGFRVESKRFPRLQGMGSDGLYYTQAEVRDLVRYAQERGIRVVPEFDMPGHSTAWYVGYPELASGPGPYAIERKWGVFVPTMDPTEEKTYKFLDRFIGEMAALFPDKYFHIGGDEVNGKQWDANPKIQEFMRRHGLRNNEALQGYFDSRVEKIVRKHGKIMLGWDEVLQPGLPKDVVVQSWRGQASLAEAARQGHRSLLSYGYYLDLMWPASRHYAVDPLGEGASGLEGEQQQAILGGEACLWSEYVSPEDIDSRIWPRAAAIAERLWSPADINDVNFMYTRLEHINNQLDGLGLTHNSSYVPMLQRMTGSGDVGPLRVLADVVEPVKDYDREDIAVTEETSLTPLNRLVDAARPESNTARRFAGMVDLVVAGTADSQTRQQLRSTLASWRDNLTELQPLAQESFLVKEAMPVSADLSNVAQAGLEALDCIEKHENPPQAWATAQAVIIAEAQKPKAQVLLAILPSVTKLIQGCSAGKDVGPVQ